MKLSTSISSIVLALLLGATASAQSTDITHAAFDMKRCVNMGNSLDAPPDADWGAPIDIAHFALIKEQGFDTVRIPVKWSAYTGAAPDYKIDPAFKKQVEDVVAAALAQDLNVILNIHHYDEIMDTPKTEFRKLLELWRQIATTFADAPENLWFEALNEPHTNLKGKMMQAAQTASVLAIRESNPTRLIILGGEDWSGIDSLATNIAPPDENIIYTFHYYDPFDFTHQRAAWLGKDMPKKKRGWGDAADRKQLKEAVETAKIFREAIKHPVFVGEFGAYDKIKNKHRVKWAEAVRTEMEAADIPWCLWSFSNTFALYDGRKNRWDDDMLQALGFGETKE